MTDQNPVPLTAAPVADQLVEHDGRTYRTIREGQAYILVPPKARTELDPRIAKEATESQKVFYNPIQQFNRDLSVLAIRTFGRDICERRRIKREGGRTKNDKKRERKDVKKASSNGTVGDVQNVASEQAQDGANQESEDASLKRAREEDGESGAPAKLVKGTDGTKIPATGAEAAQENVQATETDKMEIEGESAAPERAPQEGQTTNGASAQPKEDAKPWQPRFRILDALSATGLRALRYAQEIPFATSIVANDMDRKAVESMGLNIKHNRLESKITPNTGNAIAHMYHVAFPPEGSHGPEHISAKYDVIDLDPYGTAAPFIDAALHAINDGGLLCVTCTDSGVFASCGYPEKTFSLYGGMPIKGSHSHEGGLRLVLHSIASAAAKQGIAIEPLLSLSIDFYLRVFVRVRKSPAEVKFLAGKTMIAYNCDYGCGAWTTQLLGSNKQQASSKGDNTFWKYGIAKAPTSNSLCDHCGSKTHVAGPMWGGPIHNAAFIERMLKDVSTVDKEVYGTTERIEGMLDTALDEIYVPKYVKEKGPAHEDLIPRTLPEQLDDTPFFVIPSALAKVIHAQAPSEAAFKGALRHAGYRATRSHCKPGSIKTEAPWTAIWEIMREWVRQKCPIKEGSVKENMPGWKILQNARELEKEKDAEETAGSPEIVTEHTIDESAATVNKTGDVKKMKVVFDDALGKDRNGKKLVRYQQNPRENWGPMARANLIGTFRYESSALALPHTPPTLKNTDQYVMSQADEGKDDDEMSVARSIGQKLQGRSDLYTLGEKLHESVWKATGSLGGNVIVKSVNHFRLQNERDVLLRFQPRTQHIRPLLDEVDPGTASHALVMRWLDDDLLNVTRRRQLASSEVKYVAKGVLEALQALHADGYVHTDIKPGNVLVNETNEPEQQQITEVQLADFGSTVSQTCGHATDGDDIGTPIFRSPEAQLQMPWTTATDIWSFGIMIIDAIYGKGFHVMKPDVPASHEDFDYKIIMRYHQCFGPFPWTFAEIADEDTLKALMWVMSETPPETMQPFNQVSSKEISAADKAFVLRILKLDPRDRPTATELLDDVWFKEA